jgi:hypothetical protein
MDCLVCLSKNLEKNLEKEGLTGGDGVLNEL